LYYSTRAARRDLCASAFPALLAGNQDHSQKWLQTFKRPEVILARWVETVAEFDFVIEHRPGRLHSNVDGVSRPFCKQCIDKPTKVKWIDELERLTNSPSH